MTTMTDRFWWPLLIALLVGLLTLLVTRNAEGVEVWQTDGPAKVLAGEPIVERTTFDTQYGETRRFRGFALTPILERAKEAKNDLVVLRFSNGMVVPLSYGAPLPDLFVAVEVWSDTEDDFVALPPSVRKSKYVQDNRPIVFDGNKIVAAAKATMFTPWRHTASLVGVELTTKAEWTAPFEAGSDSHLKYGQALFQQRCVFCHAVRGEGGTLGWDFVDPLPVTTYRPTPEKLRFHVNHRVSNAAELGLLMPVPTKLDPAEARALWEWMDEVAKDADDLRAL